MKFSHCLVFNPKEGSFVTVAARTRWCLQKVENGHGGAQSQAGARSCRPKEKRPGLAILMPAYFTFLSPSNSTALIHLEATFSPC